MPTPTYTPLATVTLGSTTSSVTFSSIPATYRDLIIVLDGTNTGGDNVTLRYNGDSSSTYTSVVMYAVGSPVSATTSATYAEGGAMYGNKGNNIIQIMDYSATDKHKTALARTNTAGNIVGAYASRWPSTAAITSVRVGLTGTSYLSGTTFSLYGVIA
jgi:hypothetical protein